MSRMFLAFLSLVLLSGCQCCTAPRYVSLATARLESLGPNWSLFCPVNRSCGDGCVPHRPFTHKYEAWCDRLVTEHTAQKCAFRALCAYRKETGNPVSHHFKMGFISAYEDLALNRKPLPPIVPPPMYWNAFYRSCAGRQSVEDWFAGYDAGLDTGYNSGVSRFREIYLRRNGCNTGLAKGSAGVQFDPPDYGQPELTDGVQEPMSPNPPGMPVPTPNAFGAVNPYGVSNFQGTADPYGIQAQ